MITYLPRLERAVLPDLPRLGAGIQEVVDPPQRARCRRLRGTRGVIERAARRLRDVLRTVGVIDRRRRRVLEVAASSRPSSTDVEQLFVRGLDAAVFTSGSEVDLGLMFVPPEFATRSNEPELSMVMPHGIAPTETGAQRRQVAL